MNWKKDGITAEFVLGLKVGVELAIQKLNSNLTDKQIIGDKSFGELRQIADDKGWSDSIYYGNKHLG